MSHVELWPLKSFTFQIRNQFIKHIPKHLAYLKCFIWSTDNWFLRYTEIYWPTINWRLHPWLQGWRSILGASQAQVSSLDTLLSLPGATLKSRSFTQAYHEWDMACCCKPCKYILPKEYNFESLPSASIDWPVTSASRWSLVGSSYQSPKFPGVDTGRGHLSPECSCRLDKMTPRHPDNCHLNTGRWAQIAKRGSTTNFQKSQKSYSMVWKTVPSASCIVR